MEKTALITDFDGTITCQDTNEVLLKLYGNTYNKEIERQFIKGEIGTRQAMAEHFRHIRLTEEEYAKFIVEQIGITPGFGEFYKAVTTAGMPLVVVSGGYVNAINIILARENIQPTAVWANKLVFTAEGISNQFFHDKVDCTKAFGPCGNCKAVHVQHYRGRYGKVVFIGDGLTDRCAAELADLVYAKGRLAAYCMAKGIDFTFYNDFYDISAHLLGQGGGKHEARLKCRPSGDSPGRGL